MLFLIDKLYRYGIINVITNKLQHLFNFQADTQSFVTAVVARNLNDPWNIFGITLLIKYLFFVYGYIVVMLIRHNIR